MWDIIIATLIIIVLVLIICYYNKAEHLNIEPPVLVCPDQDVVQMTKKWFNDKSKFRGVYTMSPISSRQSSPISCDVKYQYFPIAGGPKKDAGIDFRRFTYGFTDRGWEPMGMGYWKSGTKNT